LLTKTDYTQTGKHTECIISRRPTAGDVRGTIILIAWRLWT